MPFPIICAICGESRPFKKIGVFKHDLADIPGSVYNVHYCNDKVECARAALGYNPFKDGYPKKADIRDGLPKHFSNPEATLTEE